MDNNAKIRMEAVEAQLKDRGITLVRNNSAPGFRSIDVLHDGFLEGHIEMCDDFKIGFRPAYSPYNGEYNDANYLFKEYYALSFPDEPEGWCAAFVKQYKKRLNELRSMGLVVGFKSHGGMDSERYTDLTRETSAAREKIRSGKLDGLNSDDARLCRLWYSCTLDDVMSRDAEYLEKLEGYFSEKTEFPFSSYSESSSVYNLLSNDYIYVKDWTEDYGRINYFELLHEKKQNSAESLRETERETGIGKESLSLKFGIDPHQFGERRCTFDEKLVKHGVSGFVESPFEGCFILEAGPGRYLACHEYSYSSVVPVLNFEGPYVNRSNVPMSLAEFRERLVKIRERCVENRLRISKNEPEISEAYRTNFSELIKCVERLDTSADSSVIDVPEDVYERCVGIAKNFYTRLYEHDEYMQEKFKDNPSGLGKRIDFYSQELVRVVVNGIKYRDFDALNDYLDNKDNVTSRRIFSVVTGKSVDEPDFWKKWCGDAADIWISFEHECTERIVAAKEAKVDRIAREKADKFHTQFKGFGNNFSSMQKGRLESVLFHKESYYGKVMTRKELIEQYIAEGGHVDARKDGGKTKYFVWDKSGRGFFVPKMAYDYGLFLMKIRDAAFEKPEPDASDVSGVVKENTGGVHESAADKASADVPAEVAKDFGSAISGTARPDKEGIEKLLRETYGKQFPGIHTEHIGWDGAFGIRTGTRENGVEGIVNSIYVFKTEDGYEIRNMTPYVRTMLQESARSRSELYHELYDHDTGTAFEF